jgi:hypothetical protein
VRLAVTGRRRPIERAERIECYVPSMDRSEFLEAYRQRVSDYARRQLRGEDPTGPCGAERRALQAEQFSDRNADPWGYLHAMAKVIANHNPL